jgi:hypothetical protein
VLMYNVFASTIVPTNPRPLITSYYEQPNSSSTPNPKLPCH